MSDAIPTQGFKLDIGDVGDSPLEGTEIKEIVSFTGFDGQAAEIDTTNLQSTAKEFLMGLQDFGTFNIECNHLDADPGQLEARTAKTTQTLKLFIATFSDLSTATFSAFVLSNPLSGGVDAKVDGSFALRISGDVTFA